MSLTDDWRGGKLKCWYFFLRLINDDITVGFFDGISFSCCHDFVIKEILAPCDYDYLVDLTEKVKELEKNIETLTNNYKILEGERASDIIAGQALVDEFGDYNALSEELQRLRTIERKYDNIKIKGNYPDKISKLKSRIKHLLELQANQDKEVENLRELLNECKNIVAHDCWQEAQFSDGQVVERQNLLTRINAAIGDNVTKNVTEENSQHSESEE